jgi:hypothetical protein
MFALLLIDLLPTFVKLVALLVGKKVTLDSCFLSSICEIRGRYIVYQMEMIHSSHCTYRCASLRLLLLGKPREPGLDLPSPYRPERFWLAGTGIRIEPPGGNDNCRCNSEPDERCSENRASNGIHLPVPEGGMGIGQPHCQYTRYCNSVPALHVVDGIPHISNGQVQHERKDR